MKGIFDISKFNVLQDNDYYYFFRALNNADNNDIDNKLTTTTDGQILRIRTDRERFDGITKYSEDSILSLEEIYDHIKMHYRKDTNCISLSSNANVSLVYGRGSYKDKYVLVRCKKSEINSKIINAGEYIIERIVDRINRTIDGLNKSSDIFSTICKIENANSMEELNSIIREENIAEEKYETYEWLKKGIIYGYKNIRLANYQSLNREQLLEKNKIVAKLNVLKKYNKISSIIYHVPDKKLIETLGNAFSSLEYIHYGDIRQDDIIEIPTPIVDIFALLQQLPNEYNELVNELNKDILNLLLNSKLKNDNYISDLARIKYDDNLDIERVYELTKGAIPYSVVNSLSEKLYYLSKSRIRTINIAILLNEIIEKNPKYLPIIKKIMIDGFTIEPDIINRKTNKGLQLSESVNIDLKNNELYLVDLIKKLDTNTLLKIISNDKNERIQNIVDLLLRNNYDNLNVSKEDYIAEAIIDSYDFSKLGIIGFDLSTKNDFIKKLKDNHCLELYYKFKEKGLSNKEIYKYIVRIIVRNDINLANIKEEINIDELEDFLEYYKIKGTNIKLKSYQETAVRNIDRIFENKQFAATILPTGAGKSFVALTEMLNYKNKEILYLAPSNEILDQIENYIIEYIHGKKGILTKNKRAIITEEFPNLTLAMYPTLMSNNSDEIIKKKYKLIVFDELHRTGAKEWKNKIDELISNQDNQTKFLGITATPQRDTDNIDMSSQLAKQLGYSEEEITNNEHISINLDLLEAIKLGIVINPRIIQCEYNLNNDGLMENLLEMINSVKNEELKQEYLSRYDELRRKITLADGISEILKNNVNVGNKFIVFIPVSSQEKNKINLLEDEDGNSISKIDGKKLIKIYKSEIANYFNGTNQNLEFYSMLGSYSKQRNLDELHEFEIDNPNSIKFMIVMNKLNEGIHVKNVDGIIWFRPIDEKSKILYLQQLGRIIYAMPNSSLNEVKRPLAIDLTNNTLRVNISKEKQNYERHDNLQLLSIIVDWHYEHGENIELTLSKYGTTLARIQEEYSGYLEDANILDDKTDDDKEYIHNIIEKGKEIDLWNLDISKSETKSKSKIDFESFEITGIMRDYFELYSEINNIASLSYEERIAEFIDLLNTGYIPTRTENTLSFSDGSKNLGQFWNNNSNRIIDELQNNKKYEIGYEVAKKFIDNYLIKLSPEEKLEEYIKLLNTGYVPISNELNKYFSDGSTIKCYWENNKETIIYELSNNPKYKIGYEVAKKVLNDKTQKLSYEDRIKEYIELLNNGYTPIHNDKQNKFSDGSFIGSFWYYNKDIITNEVLTNSQYSEGYDIAKDILQSYQKKTTSKQRIAEYIELLNNGYIPIAHDRENKFSDGAFINSFIRNKDKIIHELATNPQYNNGYDTAKKIIIDYVEQRKNKLSIDEKVAEYIELLNTGYVPKKIDNKVQFSNGEPINQFWSNKEKIVNELFTNPQYSEGYDIAKDVINKKINKLSNEDRIKEYIELLNTGYVPLDRESNQYFSDENCVGVFWQNYKQSIISELYSNELYNEGYDLAKIIVKLKTSEKYKRLTNEMILEIALNINKENVTKKMVRK